MDSKINNTIRVNTIHVDKDGILMLSAFRDWIDTSKVAFYSMKLNKNKTVSLKFYDKKKKLVKPYGQGNEG